MRTMTLSGSRGPRGAELWYLLLVNAGQGGALPRSIILGSLQLAHGSAVRGHRRRLISSRVRCALSSHRTIACLSLPTLCTVDLPFIQSMKRHFLFI